MRNRCGTGTGVNVALRKESVDRNCATDAVLVPVSVALRKESVDRNTPTGYNMLINVRRSPQGERG